MKIEVYKSYINAMGDVIYINGYTPYDTFPYESSSGDYFTREGLFRGITKLCKEDLICEVVPKIYEAYILDYHGQREFIEKHIKYWTKNEQTNL